MAKIITEFVQDASLFSSGVDDSFELEAASMPNGNASLVVRGDLTQDCRAFADVDNITTPDICQPEFVSTPNTIILWLKIGSLSGSDLGTPNTGNSILTVQNLLAPVQDATIATISTHYSSWKICAGGIDGRDIEFGASWKSSGGTKQHRGAKRTIPLDTWTMIAYAGLGSNLIGMSINGDAYTGSTGSSTSTASASSNASNLAVGSISVETGVGVRPGAWRLGKVSFHSGLVSTGDLTALYGAMTG